MIHHLVKYTEVATVAVHRVNRSYYYINKLTNKLCVHKAFQTNVLKYTEDARIVGNEIVFLIGFVCLLLLWESEIKCGRILKDLNRGNGILKTV